MKRRDRIERSRTRRRRVLLGGWLLALTAVVGRSAQLQVLEASHWRRLADTQHRAASAVPAARGTIYDRNGVVLAQSRERVTVQVAPDQVTDRKALRARLEETLGLSRSTSARVTDPERRWHVVPGRYQPSVAAELSGLRGVHLTRVYQRFHPHGDLARGVLGTLIDGQGTGGVEKIFDDVLTGTPGRQVVARDALGRPIPGEVYPVSDPRPGGSVRLSLDIGLQEIAHEALAEAVRSEGALGGDMIIADPASGELLAVVSIEGDHADRLSVINAPYEPGSTFKPFTIAALLKHRAASLSDTVDAENGYWIAPDGKPLRDVHGEGKISLADAVRVSSNIGVAKAALRLDSKQHYEVLRDFGFGLATGVDLPGEAGGRLRPPAEWTPRSPVSLAIGYEASVTPLQMVMGYGAIANGGELMKPLLVREVRDDEGRVVLQGTPRRIRRVARPDVTRRIAEVLVDVVESGTGTSARLESFRVAGKSGTSRVYVEGEGYESGRYFASFIGFFPAEDPQLVVYVKLDSPRRDQYYGGATAGPVTRSTLEAILAARGAPLDRKALIDVTRSAARQGDGAPPGLRLVSTSAGGGPGGGPGALEGEAEHLADRGAVGKSRSAGSLAASDRSEDAPAAAGARIPVPDVSGLSVRAAVRRLHSVGLRVRLETTTGPIRTAPGPGATLQRGDTIVLRLGAPPGPSRRASGPRGRR